MAQALRTQSSRPAAQGRAAQETTLRVETAGYGGVPVRAVVPGEALSSIERGDLPVETEVKMRVPGYGGVSSRLGSTRAAKRASRARQARRR